MNRLKAAQSHEQEAILAARSAIANGWPLEQTVVLLLDVDDPTGGAIAKGLKPEKFAEAQRSKRPGQSAFITSYILRSDFLRMTNALFPDLGEMVAAGETPGPGKISIICFSDDGAEFFLCDLPSTGAVGNA